MKKVLMRLFQLFGKYIIGAILFLLTAVLYFFIIRDGITSFDRPVIGIILAICMPSITLLYFLVFIDKPKN